MAQKRTEGLSDLQVAFCRWFVKTHNGSLSARKAGYSENSCGEIARQLLMDPRIAQYIRLLKGSINEELHLDAIDIIRKYAQIALSDMSAFVEQDIEYVPDIGPTGLQKMDQGYPMYKKVYTTKMRPLDEIDGGLIKKIRATKAGVEIELEPRDKALEKLAIHFDMFNSKTKLAMEKAYLEIEQKKLAILEKSAKGAEDPETLNKHNASIATLTALLSTPRPNRSISSFEDNN